MEWKKLTRSNRNSIIGGVCAGLGEYFNIDPIIFRIIFIALSFGGGLGLILYLVLWLIIPDENVYKYSQRMQNRQNNNTAQPENNNDRSEPSECTVEEESRQNRNPKELTGNDSKACIIGMCFILLGVFFLFNNFLHISFSKLWPFILIAVGVGMIVNYLQKSKK